MEVPLRLRMEPSSLFRPRPFQSLFRPHRLPRLAPRRRLFLRPPRPLPARSFLRPHRLPGSDPRRRLFHRPPRPLPAWPFLRSHRLPGSDSRRRLFHRPPRPLPARSFLRPHRLPGSDPSGVAFFSVPAPFGPGLHLLRLLLFQSFLRPLPCPLVCTSSRFRKEAGLSPYGAVLSASGSKKCRFIRPKEEKIFGETAAKSYLVERNPSNP